MINSSKKLNIVSKHAYINTYVHTSMHIHTHACTHSHIVQVVHAHMLTHTYTHTHYTCIQFMHERTHNLYLLLSVIATPVCFGERRRSNLYDPS